jgi:hypothetical protein
MKKIIIISSLFFACAIGYYGMNAMDDTDSRLTPKELSNIEALANDESNEFIVRCFCKTNWFSANVCSANADGSYCGGDPCVTHDSNCR